MKYVICNCSVIVPLVELEALGSTDRPIRMLQCQSLCSSRELTLRSIPLYAQLQLYKSFLGYILFVFPSTRQSWIEGAGGQPAACTASCLVTKMVQVLSLLGVSARATLLSTFVVIPVEAVGAADIMFISLLLCISHCNVYTKGKQ